MHNLLLDISKCSRVSVWHYPELYQGEVSKIIKMQEEVVWTKVNHKMVIRATDL